jgi:hypothetical protein
MDYIHLIQSTLSSSPIASISSESWQLKCSSLDRIAFSWIAKRFRQLTFARIIFELVFLVLWFFHQFGIYCFCCFCRSVVKGWTSYADGG